MYDSTHVEIYLFFVFFFLGGVEIIKKQWQVGGGGEGDWKQSYTENFLGSNFFLYI